MSSPVEIKQGEICGDVDVLGRITLMWVLYKCGIKEQVNSSGSVIFRNI
jgi:hypothetical protein